MVELSLFEKIKTIFDLIFSSSLFLILLIGIVIILIDVFFISKKNDNFIFEYVNDDEVYLISYDLEKVI